MIHGQARFTSRRIVEVDGRPLTAPRIVVAAGSRPAVPDIEGLQAVPYLTNETLFDLQELPGHLVILGAGAVGLEMAQAFRRLGSAVTVIDAGRPLARDDADAAAVVLQQLAAEGVAILGETRALRVAAVPEGIRVEVAPGTAVHGQPFAGGGRAHAVAGRPGAGGSRRPGDCRPALAWTVAGAPATGTSWPSATAARGRA